MEICPTVYVHIMVCSGLVLLKLLQHFINIRKPLESAVFIQANQKTSLSPLLLNIDVTLSIAALAITVHFPYIHLLEWSLMISASLLTTAMHYVRPPVVLIKFDSNIEHL